MDRTPTLFLPNRRTMALLSPLTLTLLVVVLASLFTAFPLSTTHLPPAITTFLTHHFPSLTPHLSPLSHSHHCIPPSPTNLIAAPLTTLPPPGTRVLVTGAAGFIGSHVATHLSTTLHLHVIAVDDLSGGFTANLPPDQHGRLTFVRGDVGNVSFVEELWEEWGPFEAVYHLAAYAAEGMSHFIRHFNYRNNLLASIALLNAAIRHRTHTFVFTSSIAVYGALTPPFTESHTPHPEDPYGIAKYAFELDLQAAHAMFGMRYVIFRPHNVYGPHQNVIDRYRNVIGIFISHIMRGLPLPVFGDGLQTRAFSYIDDVAPVIAVAPWVDGAANEVFNVGVDEAHSPAASGRRHQQRHERVVACGAPGEQAGGGACGQCTRQGAVCVWVGWWGGVGGGCEADGGVGAGEGWGEGVCAGGVR